MKRNATRSEGGGAAAAPWRRSLLAWYRRSRRDLPWRRTRDPYRIWVSEVMLQQTQVVTATPYYQTFLARFPTVTSLARARTADVLAAWSGLGYYRRARNLHAAARQVARDHAGLVPDDPEAFGRLPGVGRYTVGAVLSIAFDRPLAALDGNVARVLARVGALALSARQPSGARALWAEADALVPARRAGEWNQALMELGATVCLPRAPRCPVCPLRRSCRARAEGEPERYPPAVRRPGTVRVRRAAVLIESRGRMLMVRRERPPNLGLWEPPTVELRDGEDPGPALRRALRALGVRARLTTTGHLVRHGITHHAIEVEVWRASPSTRAAPAGARYVDPRRPGLALTGLARKLAALGREA